MALSPAPDDKRFDHWWQPVLLLASAAVGVLSVLGALVLLMSFLVDVIWS